METVPRRAACVRTRANLLHEQRELLDPGHIVMALHGPNLGIRQQNVDAWSRRCYGEVCLYLPQAPPMFRWAQRFSGWSSTEVPAYDGIAELAVDDPVSEQ